VRAGAQSQIQKGLADRLGSEAGEALKKLFD
jgi:hypothetical protein